MLNAHIHPPAVELHKKSRYHQFQLMRHTEVPRLLNPHSRHISARCSAPAYGPPNALLENAGAPGLFPVHSWALFDLILPLMSDGSLETANLFEGSA